MFMQTVLFALGIAVVVAIPWAGTRSLRAVLSVFFPCLLGAMLLVFGTLPSTAGPLFGDVGVLALWFMMINAVIAFFLLETEDGKVWPIGAGALALLVLLATSFASSTYTNAIAYSRLVGQIEQKHWSDDFQPKDPKHFRVSSQENAEMLSARAIGQATTLNANGQPNSIGSQFQVNEGVSSIQFIHNELWTITPLDWTGWGPQFDGRTPGVPGYIKVSGENPTIPAHYVGLASGQEFQYTPEALWSKNLDRLVWYYHSDKIIADKHLEVDENDKPHYIISLALPTIGWWGEKVVGALIIDPVTGEGADKFIPLGEVPSWVDRVEAMHLVHRNLDYHSKYAGGWVNRSVYGNSVLAATETHFGYGSNGEPVFQTGITAHNTNQSDNDKASKPDSLVAAYYTNTRTGKTTEYMLNGGATEKSAVDQCNLIGDVKNKSYHATTPQLYNVYGRLSYVAPLQNASHAFAGACIVSVMNVQVLAWGPSAHEADLAFKQVIVNGNTQMAIEGTSTVSKITGKVARMGSFLVSGSTTYFMLVDGTPHLFTVPVASSNKISLTREGDHVEVEYYDSHEEVMPVYKFDNLSVKLEASANETEVRTRATNEIDAAYKANDSVKLKSLLDKLSPAERALVESQLKKK